jgi:hypothetical protein
VAFGLAVLIGVGAFAGSAAELWRIADRANYGIPLALVAALDGLAIVCVISLSARYDWQAVVALAATTLLSIGLQVLSVPRDQALDRYVSAVAVHALVPLASFMAVHLSTRLDRPGVKPPPRPRPAAARPAAPVQSVAAVELELELEAPLEAPARRRPVDVDDLVPAARKILAELDLSPHDIGRPRLTDLMRAAKYPLGSKKAEALLAALRQETP